MLNQKRNYHLRMLFSPIQCWLHVILLLFRDKKSGIFNVSSNNRISKYDFGLQLCEYFNLEKDLIIPFSIENKKLVPRPKDTSLNKKITNGIGFDCGSTSNNINDLINDLKDGIKDEIIKL